jgi:hypothetical protein
VRIQVSVDGLDAVDLTTVIGDEIAYYDPETGETEHRPRTLGDLVAEKLADKIYSSLTYEARHEMTKRADRERLAIIKAKVEPIIEAAISGPIRLTNSFGEPTGPETTLNALIVDEAKKAIGGGRTDYGRGDTLAQRVIKEAVGAALAKELSAAVAAEKEKVVAAVRAKAADLIADAVKQGVGR